MATKCEVLEIAPAAAAELLAVPDVDTVLVGRVVDTVLLDVDTVLVGRVVDTVLLDVDTVLVGRVVDTVPLVGRCVVNVTRGRVRGWAGLP